jgi:hypothetical protein
MRFAPVAVAVAVALALALVLVLGLAANAWAEGERTARCQGRVATLVGSAGTDHLRGGKGPDVIVAGGDRLHDDRGEDRRFQ